jgi:cytochrome P450
MGLVDNYLRAREAPTVDSRIPGNSKTDFDRSVVIDLLVDPASAKDHSVLNASQLAEEAIILLSAGNDTTSNAMVIGIYQVLKHPGIHERLTKELTKAFPTAPKGISYEEARKLPYLVRTCICLSAQLTQARLQ